MRRERWVHLTIAGLAALPALCAAHGTDTGLASPAEWTLMAYLGGDGDLRGPALGYLRQLRALQGSEGVRVVAQFDGRLDGRAVRYGPNPADPGVDIGPTNTGDPDAAADFVRWAIRAAPARRYALLIMGHGTPIARLPRPFEAGLQSSGLAVDAGAGGDALSAHELRVALSAALVGGGIGRLDVLFLDCCYGSSIEVAYELSDVCDVMVASPGELFSPGLPWAEVGEALCRDPRMDGRELARRAIALTAETWGRRPRLGMILVALELGWARAAAQDLTALGDRLRATMPDAVAAVTLARSRCTAWGPCAEVCDIAAFGRALADVSDDPETRRLARKLSDSIDRVVLASCQQAGCQPGDDTSGARGVAVFFPPWVAAPSPDYGATCTLARAEGWARFLVAYNAHLRGLLTQRQGDEGHYLSLTQDFG